MLLKGKLFFMNNHFNKFTILTILLAFVSTVNGQTEKTRIGESIYGIVAGGILSNISNYDADSRLGFLGGIYLEWRFSEKFSKMSNLLYAQRGAESIKLSYFSWPIVLKYNLSEKIGIAAGVAWDDLLSLKADSLERDDFRTDDCRIPMTLGDYISDHLSAGISYSFGLTDITKNDNESLRNNWESISPACKIF
jgi:hypothetical protein